MEKFDTQIISVDRVDSDHICKPYQYFRNAISEQRFIMYKTTLLKEELIGLERDNNSGKIDHSTSGINSKDSADGMCGAVWNASQHAEELSIDFSEDLSTTVEVNNEANTISQKQINIYFENELIQVKRRRN